MCPFCCFIKSQSLQKLHESKSSEEELPPNQVTMQIDQVAQSTFRTYGSTNPQTNSQNIKTPKLQEVPPSPALKPTPSPTLLQADQNPTPIKLEQQKPKRKRKSSLSKHVKILNNYGWNTNKFPSNYQDLHQVVSWPTGKNARRFFLVSLKGNG